MDINNAIVLDWYDRPTKMFFRQAHKCWLLFLLAHRKDDGARLYCSVPFNLEKSIELQSILDKNFEQLEIGLNAYLEDYKGDASIYSLDATENSLQLVRDNIEMRMINSLDTGDAFLSKNVSKWFEFIETGAEFPEAGDTVSNYS